jgi:malonate-semialdehyde dehydrogenase (acetylating) / methylmalonate-semialdehyde dehydrogenase
MLTSARKSVFVSSRLFARSFSQAPTVPNFINGKFEESKATKFFDVRNPATQEVVCRVPQSTTNSRI